MSKVQAAATGTLFNDLPSLKKGSKTEATMGDPYLRYQLLDCQKKLATYVESRVEADGAVRDRCQSRVLESSLMLHLLKAENVYPSYQEKLAQYLTAQMDKEQGNVFHQTLIRAALGESTLNNVQAVENCMVGFNHFTARRKRMLFNAVLAELQVVPFDSQFQAEDFADCNYQSWVEVEMSALKVLYAFGLNAREWVNPNDLELLLTTQRASSVWEKHITVNILILLALRKFPEHRTVVLGGIDNLLSLQNPDGGIPFITRMEIFCTATAGLALAGVDTHIDSLSQIADYIAGQQQLDGGWAYSENVRQTDVDDTSYCIEFLRAVEPHKYEAYISRAESYLLAIQNEDGGFPTYLRGQQSECAMTAGALNALAPRAVQYANIFERGLHYIISGQKFNGTFERSWSLSETNAIFRSLLAMRAQYIIHSSELLESICTAKVLSLDYLRTAQNEDGGWGQKLGDVSDAISTSYALIALSCLGNTQTLKRGAEYLILQQDEDGKFVSIPDQAAPRPIPYNFPILASTFALLALNTTARLF